jgi:serine/threonine protein kinase/cell division septation protein DedD
MVIREKYKVAEKLGAGGMATVYKVQRVAFNDTFALKLVNKSLAADDQFVKRFRAEAVMAHKLQHPNIVRIFDLDTTEDGRPFMVLELVSGSDLRSLIQKSGAMPQALALDLAAQVAEGLDCAHRSAIVHRDIKPDNILVAKESQGGQLRSVAKISDFGIAKAREAVAGSTIGTSTGVLIGTPQYMSPEHAMGMRSSELDGRSDLYSLAVVLYEMLTGKLPFHSDTPMGYLLQHLQAEPTPIRDIRPTLQISSDVSALLMKGLAKDRNQRFQTGAEFAAALRDPAAWAKEQALNTAAATVSLPGRAVVTTTGSPATQRIPTATAVVTSWTMSTAASAASAPAPAATVAVAAPTAQPAAQPSAAAEVKPSKSRTMPMLIGLCAAVLVVAIGAIWFAVHRLHQARDGAANAAVTAAPAASTNTTSAASNSAAPPSPTAATVNPQPETSTTAPSPGSTTVNAPPTPAAPMAPDSSSNTKKSSPKTNPKPSAAAVNNPADKQPDKPADKPSAASPSNKPAAPAPATASTAPVNPAVAAELSNAREKVIAGEYDQAVDSYKKVLKIDPSNAEANAGIDKARQYRSAKTFFVAVGVFKKQSEADQLINTLHGKNYNAYIAPLGTDRMFHVQLGPHSRKDAAKIRQKLVKDGFSATVMPGS